MLVFFLLLVVVLLMLRRPPRSTLCRYTALFRSRVAAVRGGPDGQRDQCRVQRVGGERGQLPRGAEAAGGRVRGRVAHDPRERGDVPAPAQVLQAGGERGQLS